MSSPELSEAQLLIRSAPLNAARLADANAKEMAMLVTANSEVSDWASPSHMRTMVLIAATVFGVYFCYRMAAPFMPAITAAFALAVLFTPWQVWLEGKLRNASLAAIISVFAIAVIVVVPATFVMQRLVMQAAAGAEIIQEKFESGEWRNTLIKQPALAPIIEKIEGELDLPGAIKSFNAWFATSIGAVVKGSVLQVIGLTLTFYLLFFFLRDRGAALDAIRSLSPMRGSEMSALFKRVGDTIYATIYGTLAVAGVQGLLGGLMFWCLGLQAAFLWGLVMALLAVVPVLGAFVVWIPAALFLALEGSWGKALILTLWGLLVVGTVDNLLRPVLVGNRLKLHTVLAFLSVVGGLLVFGGSGLILGPVLLTVTMVLIEVWSVRVARAP